MCFCVVSSASEFYVLASWYLGWRLIAFLFRLLLEPPIGLGAGKRGVRLLGDEGQYNNGNGFAS
jgi:hypothetical protein